MRPFSRTAAPVRRSRLSVPGAIFSLLILACFGGACSSYRLGTGSTPEFSTLYVQPVANPAAVPQAEALVGAQLRNTLLSDGRVRLVDDPTEADAVLEVVIVDYSREAATSRPDDTGLGRKFSVTLAAAVTLRENRTGRVLVNSRRVEASRDAFAEPGLQQAEYQALPLLAELLARRSADTILDVW